MSGKKQLAMDQYPWTKKTFYGVSATNFWNLDGSVIYKLLGPNGEKIRERIDLTHFLEKKVEVDIYLDVDQGIFKLCVVGVSGEDKEIYIEGLGGSGNDDGWVPHLLFSGSGLQQQVRACSIDSQCYGKRLDIQWE